MLNSGVSFNSCCGSRDGCVGWLVRCSDRCSCMDWNRHSENLHQHRHQSSAGLRVEQGLNKHRVFPGSGRILGGGDDTPQWMQSIYSYGEVKMYYMKVGDTIIYIVTVSMSPRVYNYFVFRHQNTATNSSSVQKYLVLICLAFSQEAKGNVSCTPHSCATIKSINIPWTYLNEASHVSALAGKKVAYTQVRSGTLLMCSSFPPFSFIQLIWMIISKTTNSADQRQTNVTLWGDLRTSPPGRDLD